MEKSTRGAINRIITFYLLENCKQAICLYILIIIQIRIIFFFILFYFIDCENWVDVSVQTHRFHFGVSFFFCLLFWQNSDQIRNFASLAVRVHLDQPIKWENRCVYSVHSEYSLDLMESAAPSAVAAFTSNDARCRRKTNTWKWVRVPRVLLLAVHHLWVHSWAPPAPRSRLSLFLSLSFETEN